MQLKALSNFSITLRGLRIKNLEFYRDLYGFFKFSRLNILQNLCLNKKRAICFGRYTHPFLRFYVMCSGFHGKNLPEENSFKYDIGKIPLQLFPFCPEEVCLKFMTSHTHEFSIAMVTFFLRLFWGERTFSYLFRMREWLRKWDERIMPFSAYVCHTLLVLSQRKCEKILLRLHARDKQLLLFSIH